VKREQPGVRKEGIGSAVDDRPVFSPWPKAASAVRGEMSQ